MSEAIMDLSFNELSEERDLFNTTSILNAEVSKEYIIRDVLNEDEELKSFLFSLGCYKGEKITVISSLNGNYIINIKDARYSIDRDLAEAILV